MQDVDYVNTKDANDYADAWVLDGGSLCVDQHVARGSREKKFVVEDAAPATLVFVAGPIANEHCGSSELSSMKRTSNAQCGREAAEYFGGGRGGRGAAAQSAPAPAAPRSYADLTGKSSFFVECQRAAMRAGLDAGIEAGVDVMLVARLSGGLYAGNFRPLMTKDFYEQLVNDLLEEEVEVKGAGVDGGAAAKAGGEGLGASASSAGSSEKRMVKRGTLLKRVILPWIR